jgi:hypothetical protein
MPLRMLTCLLALGLLQSCLSYYQRQSDFNDAFEKARFQKAERILNTSEPQRKNQLLYFLNKGMTAFMQSEYEASNEAFEQAYLTAKTFQPDPGRKIASYFINPRITRYSGEHHEVLLINYFKALNYLFLNQPRKALVECRRLNIQLDVLNLQYADKRHKYQADAFINLLMGLIYDANQDYNNAFIAYRNAYQVYQEDYQELFGLPAPAQLKADLIRTAKLAGLNQEKRQYQQEFSEDLPSAHQQGRGTLVFLWHNGLGPVKDQLSLNFTLVEGSGGVATFENSRYGWQIPFPDYGDRKEEEEGLSQVEFIRLALPRYQKRPPYFQSGYIRANGQAYELPVAENITKIGFQTLEDRILRELGNAVIRLALKKGTEYAADEEDEDLGFMVNVFNTITEQADTRNWQTLPHAIHYAKVPVEPGEQTVQLVLTKPDGGEQTYDFTYNLAPGEMQFEHFHTVNTKRRTQYQAQPYPEDYQP